MNDTIFQPNYTITSTMEYRLENIERNRWLIENMLLMPKHEAWLHRDVRVKRVAGTTRIEGANLDEEAVARLDNKSVIRSEDADEQDNINALQAYDFIDYLSDQKDIPIDELVIRQLNRYFIANAAAPLTPGVYRKGSNAVGDFQPPDQGDDHCRQQIRYKHTGADDAQKSFRSRQSNGKGHGNRQLDKQRDCNKQAIVKYRLANDDVADEC